MQRRKFGHGLYPTAIAPSSVAPKGASENVAIKAPVDPLRTSMLPTDGFHAGGSIGPRYPCENPLGTRRGVDDLQVSEVLGNNCRQS